MKYFKSIALLIAVLIVTSCANDAKPDIKLAVHDSFAVSAQLKADFSKRTGISLKVIQSGDAGTLYAAALLAGDRPTADLLYGVDNSLLAQRPAGSLFAELKPIDYGYVCVNVDQEFFANRGMVTPRKLSDLVKPEYKSMLTVQDAAASSPGLAFLLATRIKFGDSWRNYWQELLVNDVYIANNWTDAYYGQFTAGGQSGQRPLVVSYSTSPAAEIIFGGTNAPASPRTTYIDDGCFKQVEYVGILTGTQQLTEAKVVLDWLTSAAFQSEIPNQMLMYPIREKTTLPEAFVKFAPAPTSIIDEIALSPAEIQQLIASWQEITGR